VLRDHTVDQRVDRSLAADVARGHVVTREHVDAHDGRARAFERVGARGADAVRAAREREQREYSQLLEALSTHQAAPQATDKGDP